MNTDVPELALGRPQGERPTAQVLKRLTPFLKPYRGRIAIAMAFLLSAKVAGLAVPMVLKRLIDTLGMTTTIAVIPVALLLAYGAARLSERVFTEMRQIVFARVMARSSRMVMLSVFRHLHCVVAALPPQPLAPAESPAMSSAAAAPSPTCSTGPCTRSCRR